MIKVFDHPLITHKLTKMRKKETDSKDFKDNLDEIASLMAYEITRNLPVKDVEIETPITKCIGKILAKEIVLIPILRAGLGMVDGVRKLIPTAKVGHIGLFRNEETLEPEQYYAKFPSCIADSVVMIVEPMLATGGSAVAAIDIVKQKGAKDIKLISLVAAPIGVETIQEKHPDVEIYVASVDEKLNEIGYIVPGLGDAGDRIFGTK